MDPVPAEKMTSSSRYAVLDVAALCAVSDLRCYAGFNPGHLTVAQLQRWMLDIAAKLEFARERCNKNEYHDGLPAYVTPERAAALT